MKVRVSQRYRLTACVWIVVAVLIGLPASLVLGENILMVGADPDPTFGDDIFVFDYLTGVLGHDVLYLQGDISTTDDALDSDLVIISSTLGSGTVRGKFVGIETPVLNWEEALMDGTTAGGNFSMGAGSENGTAGPGMDVRIINPGHPLAAGLSGTVEIADAPIPRPHIVGPVAPGVVSIATIDDSGELMDVDLAPSGIGMHIGSHNNLSNAFTGWMDEIGIWERGLSFELGPGNAVTGGDVHTIFNQGIPALANDNGLIGYWSFDDVADSSVAVDGSDSGFDATLDGGAFKVDDDVAPTVGGSGALYLDGTGDVNVVDMDRPGGELAYAFWFKADGGVYGPEFDTADPRVDFFYGNGELGSVRPHLSANRSGRPIGLYVADDTGDLATPIESGQSSLTSDEWHHVVITWDGEQGNVFVDGILDDADFDSSLFAITAVDVGGELSDGTLATQRIVNFPIQDVGFASLTDDGLKLFDAAIAWLLGGASIPGDFNGDGILDMADIDDLTMQSASQSNPAGYDLNGDTLVNDGDITIWINDLFGSWIGDADLDGQFNSGDLVVMLATGTYENDVPAVWSTGDFNGDGRTNSGDLVFSLSGGGYEAGPRPAAAVVPEPAGVLLMASAACLLGLWRRAR